MIPFRGSHVNPTPGGKPMRLPGLVSVAVLFSAIAMADSVQLSNGDRLTGKVVAVDDKTITIETEALGKVSIKKSFVQSVAFGEAASKDIKRGGIDPQLIKDVQKQVPELAAPEAAALFGKMAEDYVSGKLSERDLRREAMHIHNEFKQVAKDLGPEAVAGAKSYLSTLAKLLEAVPDDKNYTVKDYQRVGELTCWLKPGMDADAVAEVVRQVEGSQTGMVVAHRDPKFQFL